MAQVYFIACPIGTICDTLNATLAGWNENFIQPCIPDTLDNGVNFFTKDEDYVVKFSDNDPVNFREVDWSNKIHDLKHFLKKVNKNIIIGSYKPEQLKIIKENIPTVSIGINYTQQQFKLVVSDVIKIDAITKNKKLANLSKKEIDDYAEQEYIKNKVFFNRIIPDSFYVKADYNINIEDFYNKHNFIKFIEKIDGKRNKKQIDFYNKWLYNNISIRK